MDENEVKIQVKVGQLEVGYEGKTSFLENNLLGFVKETIILYGNHINLLALDPDSYSRKTPKETPPTTNKDKKFDLSMTTVASRLEVKSGPDLILAACMYLTFVEGKEKFSKDEIHEKMKGASGFYNAGKVSHIKRDLRKLMDKKFINEASDDRYELHAENRDALETRLRNSQ